MPDPFIIFRYLLWSFEFTFFFCSLALSLLCARILFRSNTVLIALLPVMEMFHNISCTMILSVANPFLIEAPSFIFFSLARSVVISSIFAFYIYFVGSIFCVWLHLLRNMYSGWQPEPHERCSMVDCSQTHTNTQSKKKNSMRNELREKWEISTRLQCIPVLSVACMDQLSYPQPDYEQRHCSALLLKWLLFLVDHFCDWIFSHYSISIFLLAAFLCSCVCMFFLSLIRWWPVFCFAVLRTVFMD